MRRGVSQRWRRVASQDRAPVAPAPAAIALIMHCMHMALRSIALPAREEADRVHGRGPGVGALADLEVEVRARAVARAAHPADRLTLSHEGAVCGGVGRLMRVAGDERGVAEAGEVPVATLPAE